MREPEVLKSVEIPENVEVMLEGRVVTVRGEKGTLKRGFSHIPVSIRLDGRAVKVWANWPRKREEALVGTVCSHIHNMIIGVTKGFTYKLKVVFSHFPISINVKGNRVLIENFIGERSPRVARIIGGVKVTAKDEDVIVQGISIDDVSQTAHNIQDATNIKRRDPRKFLDGIYVYERLQGMKS